MTGYSGESLALSDLPASEIQNLINLADAAAQAAMDYATANGGTNGNTAAYLLAIQLADKATLLRRNIQGSQPVRTAVVSGAAYPDLFSLCAQFYGDPSQAMNPVFLAANNLSCPLLSALLTYTIIFPDLPATT